MLDHVWDVWIGVQSMVVRLFLLQVSHDIHEQQVQKPMMQTCSEDFAHIQASASPRSQIQNTCNLIH